MHNSFVLISIFVLALASACKAAAVPPYPLHQTFYPDLSRRQTVSSDKCAKSFHIIYAAGCDVPCSKDPTPPTFLDHLIPRIHARWPRSTSWFVPYTGSEDQASVSTPFAVAGVEAYAESCPDTPIILFGYSLGAVIIMNTLCSTLYPPPNIIAAVVYGDETFRANQTYDVSTCKNDAPEFPRANLTACQTFAPVLQSYCLEQDPQCCTNGTDGDSHFAYGPTFNNNTIAFITAKYQAWKISRLNSTKFLD